MEDGSTQEALFSGESFLPSMYLGVNSNTDSVKEQEEKSWQEECSAHFLEHL
jgi:hypothetical protein